jgi:hypothetical protein
MNTLVRQIQLQLALEQPEPNLPWYVVVRPQGDKWVPVNTAGTPWAYQRQDHAEMAARAFGNGARRFYYGFAGPNGPSEEMIVSRANPEWVSIPSVEWFDIEAMDPHFNKNAKKLRPEPHPDLGYPNPDTEPRWNGFGLTHEFTNGHGEW